MLLSERWVLTVSELNDYIRKLLNSDPLTRSVTVCGELTGYKQHFSGHRYFSLKDENARVHCVIFRQDATTLDFVPQDGMKVIVQGNATVYPRDGIYQIVVHRMTPYGIGDLYAKFEALKHKLGMEGLFDPDRKREIPVYPKQIGIITSLSGAALYDIIRIARRRNPGIGIIIAPCAVQGTGAAEDIARAIRLLNDDGRCDVLLIGRGGGSAEELWAFNEEVVARAIAASRIPTISCVGHEVDVTIADFVADKRAATPSAAAEIAVPLRDEIIATLDTLRLRLASSLNTGQKHRRAMLNALSLSAAMKRPWLFLIEPKDRLLTEISQKYLNLLEKCLSSHYSALDLLSGKLVSLNPQKVLERGYAIVSRNGEIIKSAGKLQDSDVVDISLADGSVSASILRTSGKGPNE